MICCEAFGPIPGNFCKNLALPDSIAVVIASTVPAAKIAFALLGPMPLTLINFKKRSLASED